MSTPTALRPQTGADDVLLWDVDTAARETGLTSRYMRRLVDERRIPTVKLGRLVRVRPADVRAYIEANTRPAREALR
ncbi:excisionase family DNA-binding protein [Microbacterium sp. NPDC056569]|uniref:excisionase family DNA-binding protein n=1 Tax=Microbacterium sp. NPDC056569 TaxID=3345867 RepID=UPI00366B33F8